MITARKGVMRILMGSKLTYYELISEQRDDSEIPGGLGSLAFSLSLSPSFFIATVSYQYSVSIPSVSVPCHCVLPSFSTSLALLPRPSASVDSFPPSPSSRRKMRVRYATPPDFSAIADLCPDAFMDDELFVYVCPQQKDYPEHFRSLFLQSIKVLYYNPHAHLLVAETEPADPQWTGRPEVVGYAGWELNGVKEPILATLSKFSRCDGRCHAKNNRSQPGCYVYRGNFARCPA